MDRIKMRTAVEDEAESIAQLVNRAYRPVPGAERGWTHEGALVDGERVGASSVKSALRRTVVLVGVIDSRIVGCVQVELNGRAAHIGMLAVDPFLQGSGMGKLLLAGAEEFAVNDLEAE